MFIEQLHQEPFLLFFLLVLVLPLLYEVLGLGDEEDGGGHVDGQLPPHLPRAPIHRCLVDNIFSLVRNGSERTRLCGENSQIEIIEKRDSGESVFKSIRHLIIVGFSDCCVCDTAPLGLDRLSENGQCCYRRCIHVKSSIQSELTIKKLE